MQAGKGAMESVKETASNVAASAKAGMDKTKATVQEKVDKIKAHSPAEKVLAEERKREKIRDAEIAKQRDQKAGAHTGGHVADPGDYSVGGRAGSSCRSSNWRQRNRRRGGIPSDWPGDRNGEGLYST